MKLLFCVWLLATCLNFATGTNYQTWLTLSSVGSYFQHRFSIQLLSVANSGSGSQCAFTCSQLSHCRTFDYDPSSKQCRLFEADSTTGAISPSPSPTSIVGFIQIIPDLYSPTHNQPCTACAQSRYEVCSSNTSTCQCPPRTYWNGQICRLQLFENDACTQADACRSDMNLTCSPDCYGEDQRCVPTLPSLNWNGTVGVRRGVTVAGGCNGSSSTNQTALTLPYDISLATNETLYVANDDGRILAFDKHNRTGRTVATFGGSPRSLYFDNRTAELYLSLRTSNLIYVLPSNRTIPPDGVSTCVCSTTRLCSPTAVTTDSMGNAYISSTSCNQVVKWGRNASNGTVVAGLSNGSAGNSAQALSNPYGLALDEANGYLYVADRNNSRIQRFFLNGSSPGVTIAGGNGAGTNANQLNFPINILLSEVDDSIYIADFFNNRVQKWFLNSSVGITVAGSLSGLAGQTASLVNRAYDIALSEDESYLYVTDRNNSRIQRYDLM